MTHMCKGTNTTDCTQHTVMQTCRPMKSAFYAFWQSMRRRNQREWGERKSCACSFPFYIDRVTKELQVCEIFVLVTPSKIVMNVNVEWCCTAKHQSCIWFRTKTRSDSMRLCGSHCHEYKSDQKQINHTRVITVWDFHSVIIVSENITVSQHTILNSLKHFFLVEQMFESMCLFKFH